MNLLDKAKKTQNKTTIYNILCLVLISIVLLALLIYFFRLTPDNFKTPLTYNGGDAIQEAMLAKAIMENGWVGENFRLGAPFGTDLYDFLPFFLQNFDLLVLKFILLFVKDPFFAINIEFLITPFFIAFITFFVLRELEITHVISVCMSLTYAMLPYYFIRNIAHLVLSMYQFVPLAVLICVWCYRKQVFRAFEKKELYNKRNWCVLFFSILIANNGIGYYPAFTVFFLLITALLLFAQNKKVKAAVPSFIAAGFICIFFAASLLPPFLVNSERGRNSQVAHRSVIEADLYGLKISQMILPYHFPGIKKIDQKIEVYRNNAPLVNENESAYLGVIGSIGFVFLLWQFLKRSEDTSEDIIFLFSRLMLFGTLLGVIGGFGSVFAVTITSMLRGYNRISVFIAFFAIAGLAKYLDMIYAGVRNKKAAVLVCIIVALTGLLFQYPKNPIAKAPYMPTPPPFEDIKKHYNSDKKFIEEIESRLPAGAMVYQFPYHKYPEAGHVEKMEDYHLMTGYVHSKNLRWSYGSVKGRGSDRWQEQIAGLPLEQRIKVIALVGFEGIYIDTRAYTARAMVEIGKNLQTILHVEPIVSDDKNLAFYSLDVYKKLYLANFTEQEQVDIGEALLKAAQFKSITGLYEEEKNTEKNWRWMNQQVTMVIQNDGDGYEKDLAFTAVVPSVENADFSVVVNDNITKYEISKDGKRIFLHVFINHGENIIRFKTNAPKITAENDNRNLYVMLLDFEPSDFLLDLMKLMGS